MRKLLASLILLLAACTNRPYHGTLGVGADDFVIDSYCIRDGKFGILELEGRSFEPLACALLEEDRDEIQNGDLLCVTLHHPERSDLAKMINQLSERVGFQVIEGKLSLPDLCAIEILGCTLEEATQKIEKALIEEIDEARVFLSFKEKPGRTVQFLGNVSKPTLVVDGKLRLFEALSAVKMPANVNLFKSYVVRNGRLLPVDLYKLVKEGDMGQNIVLCGGDKVFIADTGASHVMVMGEVGKPQVLDLPDGFMSLRQALAASGGLLNTADRRYIQVIRGNLNCPKIYTLHWRHMMELPNQSLLLMPGDLVYVAATPLTEWDRFVNQILPTIVGIDLVTRGAKNVGITLP